MMGTAQVSPSPSPTDDVPDGILTRAASVAERASVRSIRSRRRTWRGRRTHPREASYDGAISYVHNAGTRLADGTSAGNSTSGVPPWATVGG
ncbi:hypothetical protein GCM10009758_14970 [Microbacterium hatanonis]